MQKQTAPLLPTTEQPLPKYTLCGPGSVFFKSLAVLRERMRAHRAGRPGRVPLVWNNKGVGLWAFPWPRCHPGPQKSEDQRPGIAAGRANSSSRSIRAGARAPPTQMRLSLRLWKPELMKFQKDETVWVWASAWDADGAAEGPQPRRELNEFVRELKTDDFNQQGGKKMTSWLQLTERGSVWLPGPARRHFQKTWPAPRPPAPVPLLRARPVRAAGRPGWKASRPEGDSDNPRSPPPASSPPPLS